MGGMTLPLANPRFIASAARPPEYPPPGPPEIAFAGRSNVGKSSLINALVRHKKLVRVSGTPGRTQRLNFFACGDDRLRLVDLPGYGFAKVPPAVKASWQGMVEAYLTGRPTLAGVVVILDIRRELRSEDRMLLDFLAAHRVEAVVAATKADKLSGNQRAARLAKLRQALGPGGEPVPFSATTGLGRPELLARLEELLPGG
jgi:GTP-binding protein